MISIGNDDLHHQSFIQSRQKQLTQLLTQEVKVLTQQPNSNYQSAAGLSTRKYNNSSSLKAQSLNRYVSSSAYSQEPAHILGDYNSVATLPVIGSEINLEGTARRQFSKVELSRKDMQNFLINGSISKEFIQLNKKELQKFIKAQSATSSFRQMLDSNVKIKGFDQSRNGKEFQTEQAQPNQLIEKSYDDSIQRKNTRVFGKTQASLLKSKDQEPSKVQVKVDVVEPQHQKPEKKFLKDQVNISDRVLETWLNETLTLAQHLDIPGVILKPEYKNPTTRYGIDRLTMQRMGLSSDDTDRIYRCLFVYSVGFFEMLQDSLQQTEQNFQMVTSIWKVFQILLEYCCKTDYQIMMAQISTKYAASLEKLLLENAEKVQQYILNEKVFTQNIETMQDYQDKLEKEKQNEKTLRLKLEEEYMQNTRNHEEEVKLRLKFEAKLNHLYSSHRELIIKYDRNLTELLLAQNHNSKLEVMNKGLTEELLQERQKAIDFEYRARELTDYKKLADKEIKHKTIRLKNADKETNQVKDDNSFVNYSIHDAKTELEAYRLLIEQLKIEASVKNNEFEREQLLLKEAENKCLKFENLFVDMKAQVEEAIADKEKFLQVNCSLESKVAEQHNVINEMRKEQQLLKDQSFGFQNQIAQLFVDLEISQKYRFTADEEVITTAQQLRQMNEERHKTIRLFEAKIDECVMLRDELASAKQRITQLEVDMVRIEKQLAFYTEELNHARMTIKENDLQSSAALKALSSNLYEANQFTKEQTKQLAEKEGVINDLETKLKKAKKSIENLSTEKVDLIAERDNLKEKLKNALYSVKLLEERITILRKEVNDAIAAKDQAELVQLSLDQQIKLMRRSMTEQKELQDSQLQAINKHFEFQEEQITMRAEDILSYTVQKETKYSAMAEERIELLEIKKRKDFLEENIKQAGEQLMQNQVLIETKEAHLQKLSQEYKQVKYTLEQQLKKDERAHKLQINELEQKITMDSLTFQQKQKKLMDENARQLKELTECKFSLRTLQTKKVGGSLKSSQKTESIADEVTRANKATQTQRTNRSNERTSLKQNAQLQINENDSMRQSSQSLISDGNTLLSSTKNSLQIKKKMAQVKDANQNDIDKEDEDDLDDQGEDKDISQQVHFTQKHSPNFERKNKVVKDKSQSNQVLDTSQDPNQSFTSDGRDPDDMEEPIEEENELIFSDGRDPDDMEEPIEEENELIFNHEEKRVGKQVETKKAKAKKQKNLFEKFKTWLLESEFSMLKKVMYMVLKGVEVTPQLMQDMRKKQVIPFELRQIKLTQNQHEDLQLEQELQKAKYQSEFLQKIDIEDEYEEQILTNRAIEQEVMDLKFKQDKQKNVAATQENYEETKQQDSAEQKNDFVSQYQQLPSDVVQGVNIVAQKNVVNAGDQLEVTKPLQPKNAKINKNPSVLTDSNSNDQTFRQNVYGENELIKMNPSRADHDYRRKEIIIENAQTPMSAVFQGGSIAVSLRKTPETTQTKFKSRKLDTPPTIDILTSDDKREQNLLKKEKQINKFKNAFSNFGANNKAILTTLIEEQKDREAFRAKQLAMQVRVENKPKITLKKVGKHLLKETFTEDERIKHIRSFLSELKFQETKLLSKKDDEKQEIENEEQLRLQEEIKETQLRLERMQKTVIVREDLIKKQFEEEKKQKLEQIWIEREMITQEQLLALDSQKFIVDMISYRSNNGQEKFENESQESKSKINLTKSDIEQLQEDAKESEISQEVEFLQKKLKEEEEEFVALEALRSGGVAHLNRKVLEQRKLEEISELQKLKERQDESGERRQSKKLGKSTIRTIIKAVDSRNI